MEYVRTQYASRKTLMDMIDECNKEIEHRIAIIDGLECSGRAIDQSQLNQLTFQMGKKMVCENRLKIARYLVGVTEFEDEEHRREVQRRLEADKKVEEQK